FDDRGGWAAASVGPRTYLRTVLRARPNSLAMARKGLPCTASSRMVFTIPLLSICRPFRSVVLYKRNDHGEWVIFYRRPGSSLRRPGHRLGTPRLPHDGHAPRRGPQPGVRLP